MSYCTLEEAWGSDFKKKHKKTKKERRYEREEKKMMDDAVDPNILIPESHRLADTRKRPVQTIPDRSNIQGFDPSNMYISPYQRYAVKEVEVSNENVIRDQEKMNSSSLIRNVERPIEEMVKLTKQEYDKLINTVEGFGNQTLGNQTLGNQTLGNQTLGNQTLGNQTDEQFNQLLLFIFTGILYLFMLDMMYQLGKKSY
jgi:hypothetical protein